MKASKAFIIATILGAAAFSSEYNVKSVPMDFICDSLPSNLAKAYNLATKEDPEFFCNNILKSSINPDYFPCDQKEIARKCVLEIAATREKH